MRIASIYITVLAENMPKTRFGFWDLCACVLFNSYVCQIAMVTKIKKKIKSFTRTVLLLKCSS